MNNLLIKGVNMSYQDIDAKELKNMLQDQQFCLIDVRSTEECDEVSIKEAINLPLASIDANKLQALVDEKGITKIAFSCRSGMRSLSAIDKLSEFIDHNSNIAIYNVKGGITGWIKMGYPVEQDI